MTTESKPPAATPADDSTGNNTDHTAAAATPPGAAGVAEMTPPHAASAPGGGFPIVGIGASAGGLGAFKTFLQAMPADSGMAFVLVQHLDPTHDSMMAPLLAKSTAMRVVEITNGVRVEPNTVYMIPPNCYLQLHGGRLQLREPIVRRGMRMPIDHFFRSMASELHDRAICIVLTGTGSDGMLGMRAVKGEGGTALAQDPTSSQYDGMPRSAIATGLIDMILPIHDMPGALLRFVREPGGWSQGDDGEGTPTAAADLNGVIALLHARTGHDFHGYKQGMLQRRLQRRMGLREVSTATDYLHLLNEEPGEVAALLGDLLIGVTAFFRDPDAWKELEEHALLGLLMRKNTLDPLRVWVPGCCTGEEAYSIAMLILELQERLGRRCAVQIFASDLDEASLDTARNGVYPDSIAADLSPERLERFFQAENGRYRVRKEVRELIVFANQNLVRDPPFSRLDLISCRNLLIYLDAQIQKRVLTLLHYSLRDGGYLFLGPSESTAKYSDLFEPLSRRWSVHRRIGSTQREVLDIPLARNGGSESDERRTRLLPGLPREPRAGSVTALAHEVLLQEFVPATALVNRRGEAVYFHGPVSRYISIAAGEPTRDITELVRDGLSTKLRSAMQRALRENAVVIATGRLRDTNDDFNVRLTVRPLALPGNADPLLLITFEDAPVPAELAATGSSEAQPDELRQLEYELSATREDLNSMIEELETSLEELMTSNEEVMSMNEELKSTNEELETTKEELQSLNEELTTVNSQLQDKVQHLESANNDMANLLNSTSIATLFLDRALQVRMFTPQATRLFRLIDADIGRHLEDITKRFPNGDFLAQARQVLDNLQPAERVVESEDGGSFLCRMLPYRTLDDRIDGVVLTFVEITERRRADEALARSEQRLSLALDAVRDGVWDWDLRTGQVFRSPRYMEIIERIPGEHTNDFAFFVSFIHPEDRSRVLATIEAHKRGETPNIDFTFRLAQTDESRPDKWLHARGKAVARDTDGAALRMVGTLSDVTAHQEAELRLTQLSQVVEQCPQCILITDLEGRIEYANEAVLQVLGYARDEVVGQNPRLFQSGRTPPATYEALWSRMSAGASWHGELIDRRRDGSEVVFMATISPISESDYSISHYAAVMLDITDRKRMAQELEQHRAHLQDLVLAKTAELDRARQAAEAANVAKSAFLANMSHEIRTPMNGVLGMASLLRLTGMDARQTGYLEKMEASGRHLLNIINDILDLSKIEAGKVVVELQDFSIGELVRDVLAITGEQLRRKGLQLVLDLPHEPGRTLRGDRAKLVQALVNYVGNAVKFTDHGSITIRGRCEQEDQDSCLVRLEVIDTGIGVQAGTLERLFTVFEQGDNTSTRRYGGTGLGLAIVKRIAQLMGGEVGVESTPGEGSRFWITARLGRLASAALPTASLGSDGMLDALRARHSGKVVLVAEDDATSAEVASALLRHAGLEHDMAPHGGIAVELARKRRYDLVLMDVQMPVLGGLEATRALRALPDYARVPVIALTANAFDVDRERCAQAGMDDFIAKPFQPADLYAALLAWLEYKTG
ncbi:MAG: hypothetical protein RIQ60_1340 [Pseudomonadota bacterium]|jgi:two-component system CheB/CheR fusion protein